MKIVVSILLSLLLAACSVGGESRPPGPGGENGRKGHKNGNDDLISEVQTIRQNLKWVLVEAFRLNEALPTDQVAWVTDLANDLRTCGLSFNGPACLKYGNISAKNDGELVDVYGLPVFLAEVKHKSWKKALLFAFDINDIKTSHNVDVYLKLKDRQPGMLAGSYLHDETSVQYLANFRLAMDFVGVAKRRLQTPADLRELYHVAFMLREKNQNSDSGDDTLDQFIKNALEANRFLLRQGEHFSYVYDLMTFYETFNPSEKERIAYLWEMLYSPSREVHQYAATNIIYLDSETPYPTLRPLVLEALNHERARTRIRALVVLARLGLTEEEKIQVLYKLDDDDIDVRETAINITGEFMVTDIHLPILQELLKSKHAQTRNQAQKLIDRLNQPPVPDEED